MGGKKKVVSPWLHQEISFGSGDWGCGPERHSEWACVGCLSESFEIPSNALRIRFVAGGGANSLKFSSEGTVYPSGIVSGYGDGESYHTLMYPPLSDWLSSIEESHGGWHWVEVEVPS